VNVKVFKPAEPITHLMAILLFIQLHPTLQGSLLQTLKPLLKTNTLTLQTLERAQLQLIMERLVRLQSVLLIKFPMVVRLLIL
jgi:hypothetical protein